MQVNFNCCELESRLGGHLRQWQYRLQEAQYVNEQSTLGESVHWRCNFFGSGYFAVDSILPMEDILPSPFMCIEIAIYCNNSGNNAVARG